MQRISLEQAGLSSAGLDAVDAAVRAQVDAGWLAGAVTLTARHGKIARVSVMGVDDAASGKPLAEDTIFRIFSMTKPVTATAMMILHDRGLWSADDPVAKHLPELAEMRVLVGEDLVAPDHAPTMAELMTHRAGFAYGIPFGDPIDRADALYREAQILGSHNLRDMMARLAKLPLAYQPGTQWRYSLAMEVQGAIIERLSGQSLPDFMREHLFEPLGMTDTDFFVPPDKRERLARLYLKMPDAPLAALPGNPLFPDYDAEPSLALGGGGLYSTVFDYARYAQMLLDGGMFEGRRIVSADGVRAQMTNRLPEEMLA